MFPRRIPSEEQRIIFGSIVRGARKSHGLTQERLAEQMNCSAAWISQVERGISNLNYIDTLRLLSILQLDVDFILEALGINVPVHTS